MTTTVSSRIGRLLALIPYLASNPGTKIADLEERFGLPSNTLLTELDRILLCGQPPYLPHDYIAVDLEGDRLSLRFAEHFRQPLRLTLSEATALLVATRSLPIAAGGPLSDAAEKLSQHLASALPTEDRKSFDLTGPRIQTPFSSDRNRRMQILHEAIEAQTNVMIEYYTAGRDEMTSRQVTPWALLESEGEWYLVGHCHQRNARRHFKTTRIRNVESAPGKSTFPDSPNDLSLEEGLTDWRGRLEENVTLRFGRTSARFVRDRLPAREQRPLPNGGVELTLAVKGFDWILPWLLPFVNDLEVVHPPQLGQALADSCRDVLSRYEDDS